MASYRGEQGASTRESPAWDGTSASAGTSPVRALAPIGLIRIGQMGALGCDTMNGVPYASFPQSPETEVPIPSYIPDLEDILATWYQATNDGSGWKLEKTERPLVGDYLHSEFRKSVTASPGEIEARICAILTERDPNAKTAVCRLDRTGRTLDGWRHRTLNTPVRAAAPSHAKLNLPGP